MALDYKPTDLTAKIDVPASIMSEGAKKFTQTLEDAFKVAGNGLSVLANLLTVGVVNLSTGSKKDEGKAAGADDANVRYTPTHAAAEPKQATMDDIPVHTLKTLEDIAQTKGFKEALVAMGGVGAAAISASALEIKERVDSAPVLSVAAPERDKTGPSLTLNSTPT